MIKLKTIINEESVKFPKFKLLKQYPSMEYKVGTIFTQESDGAGYTPNGRNHSSAWTQEYFEKWLGSYYKLVK